MYKSILNEQETEHAIKLIKDTFQIQLSSALQLRRVTAPLFVKSGLGLNDDLNGVEHPVSFNIKSMNGQQAEIVHSLAKWKRMKLLEMKEKPGYGIYTDMNAIRPDEDLDALHSLYVDQWDWEKVIDKDTNRNVGYLQNQVNKIYRAIKRTEYIVCERYPQIESFLPDEIKFITSEELLNLYPNLSPKERENEICKIHKAVFICGIGAKLSNGEKHDGRAADYDDWSTNVTYTKMYDSKRITNKGLNGDILVWYPQMNRAIELSSMGIRVNAETLKYQLNEEGHNDWASRKYHQMILNNELPQTIGGGIGQSRLCMVLLHKMHIGEIQVSLWPDEEIEKYKEEGIGLL